MMRHLFILLLLSALGFAEIVSGIAILVKDKAITLQDIRNEMGRNGQKQQEAIDALIRNALEELEAEERGVSVSDAELFDEIKKIAQQNNLNIIQLYTQVQQSQGLNEEAFKASVKKRLLTQKLFGSIAYSKVTEPTADEIEEYYRLHIDRFNRPEAFDVVVKRAASRQELEEKIANPMFHSPGVTSQDVTLQYNAIEPQLAQLLNRTPNNSFTQVFPDQQGFIAFFVKEKRNPVTVPLEDASADIKNRIMGEKRQQVLGDHFMRLRLITPIKTLRLP